MRHYGFLVLFFLLVLGSSCNSTPRASQSSIEGELMTSVPGRTVHSQNPVPRQPEIIAPTLFENQPQSHEPVGLPPLTLEKAGTLIKQLQSYPDALPAQARGYHDGFYHFSYMFASLVQAETTYRFSLEVGHEWHWLRARNLAAIGSPEAGTAFASLIIMGLANGETTVDGLSDWVATHEPEISLIAVPFSTPASPEGAYLLELRMHMNGAYLWLTQSDEGYEIYPLHSELDFGYAHAAGFHYILADLTGDGVAEIITSHARQSGSEIGPTLVEAFDVNEVPPRKLRWDNDFEPPRHWMTWESDGNGLKFELWPGTPFCSHSVVSRYAWNGTKLALQQRDYPSVAEILGLIPEDEAHISCANIILNTVKKDAYEGQVDALEFLDELLPHLPFDAIDVWTKLPYPQDARDRFRFELALYYAFHNRPEASIQLLQQLQLQPIESGSIWQHQAEEFLDSYIIEHDFLIACQKTSSCYPLFDIRQLAEQIQGVSATIMLDTLNDLGLPILASGTFESESTTRKITWFLLEAASFRTADAELWVIVNNDTSVELHYAGLVSPHEASITFQPLAELENLAVYSLQVGKDEVVFIIKGTPDQNSAEFVPIWKYATLWTILHAYEGALFEIRTENNTVAELEAVVFALERTVDDGELAGHRYHDLMYAKYLLGLAYELKGNIEAAIRQYDEIWRHYPLSPFAIIAQAKLFSNQ